MVTSARIASIRSAWFSSAVLGLGNSDVGGVLVFHALHVIAGIHVMHLARNSACQIRQEIEAGAADLFDGYSAPQRRIVLVPTQDVAEVGDARGGERLDGAGRDGVDTDAVLAEVGS